MPQQKEKPRPTDSSTIPRGTATTPTSVRPAWNITNSAPRGVGAAPEICSNSRRVGDSSFEMRRFVGNEGGGGCAPSPSAKMILIVVWDTPEDATVARNAARRSGSESRGPWRRRRANSFP